MRHLNMHRLRQKQYEEGEIRVSGIFRPQKFSFLEIVIFRGEVNF